MALPQLTNGQRYWVQVNGARVCPLGCAPAGDDDEINPAHSAPVTNDED